jgi:hypothetical protein
MLESYRKNAGTPCARCASMKLTENKFIISEYSKHHRTNRPVTRSSPGLVSVDTLGPDGLGFGPREFRLGTLEELFSRRDDCPFCGLAVTSLSEQCKSSIQDPDIELETEAGFYKAKVACFASMYRLFFKLLFYSRRFFLFTKFC